MEFKRKNKSKFWYSPIVLIVIFCFLIVFSYKTISLVKKERETYKNKNIAMNRVDELQSKKDFYKKEITNLDTDKGVEELARSKYQVVKPGEKVVSIVFDDEIVENNEPEKEHSFWSWFRNMFN